MGGFELEFEKTIGTLEVDFSIFFCYISLLGPGFHKDWGLMRLMLVLEDLEEFDGIDQVSELGGLNWKTLYSMEYVLFNRSVAS